VVTLNTGLCLQHMLVSITDWQAIELYADCRCRPSKILEISWENLPVARRRRAVSLEMPFRRAWHQQRRISSGSNSSSSSGVVCRWGTDYKTSTTMDHVC